jgi:hypothetical protein
MSIRFLPGTPLILQPFDTLFTILLVTSRVWANAIVPLACLSATLDDSPNANETIPIKAQFKGARPSVEVVAAIEPQSRRKYFTIHRLAVRP